MVETYRDVITGLVLSCTPWPGVKVTDTSKVPGDVGFAKLCAKKLNGYPTDKGGHLHKAAAYVSDYE
jgi:hypothetical protein